MEIPKGFTLAEGLDPADYCLRLKQNLYGNKEGGRTWFEHMKKGLLTIGFQQSAIDPCVFYRANTLFLSYVDDCIIASPDAAALDQVFVDLRAQGFTLDDDGDISDFLGVAYKKQDDGSYLLTQDKLIDQILHDLNFKESVTRAKDTPAPVG